MSGSLVQALRNPFLRKQRWWIVDAHGHRVGRLATQLTSLLRGKYKPIFSPQADVGDYVVVINARHVRFTGDKWTQKYYKWYTGNIGGLKHQQAKYTREVHPDNVIRKAVMGMLPRNRLRNRFEERLLIYPDSDHPHKDKELKEFIPIATNSPRDAYQMEYPEIQRLEREEYIPKKVDEKTGEVLEYEYKKKLIKPTLAHDRYLLKQTTRKLKKEGAFTPSARAKAEPPPGLIRKGPSLSFQERYLIKKLIATGYEGENWPVPPSDKPTEYAKWESDLVISNSYVSMKKKIKKPERIPQDPINEKEFSKPIPVPAEVAAKAKTIAIPAAKFKRKFDKKGRPIADTASTTTETKPGGAADAKQGGGGGKQQQPQKQPSKK